MSRRNFLILVFSVVMGCIATLGYAWQSKAPSQPARISLPNNGGLVVFDHQRHSEAFKVDCGECHHTGSYTKCEACHGATIDEAFVKNHKTAYEPSDCLACHHQGFEKTVRTHAMHPALIKQNCQYCHHKKYIERRPTNCAKCHRDNTIKRRPCLKDSGHERGLKLKDARHERSSRFCGERKGKHRLSLKDAGHERCGTCHDNAFEGKSEKGCGFCHNSNSNLEKFNNGDSVDFAAFSVPCGQCHKNVKPEALIPNRMNAYHSSCMKCHEKNGKGPFSKKQCRQCHTN